MAGALGRVTPAVQPLGPYRCPSNHPPYTGAGPLAPGRWAGARPLGGRRGRDASWRAGGLGGTGPGRGGIRRGGRWRGTGRFGLRAGSEKRQQLDGHDWPVGEVGGHGWDGRARLTSWLHGPMLQRRRYISRELPLSLYTTSVCRVEGSGVHRSGLGCWGDGAHVRGKPPPPGAGLPGHAIT